MTILSIETSCDETALALIETRLSSEALLRPSERSEVGAKEGRSNSIFECRILSSLIHSQAKLHSPYGGVFPTLAKREHEKNLPLLLKKMFKEIQDSGFMIQEKIALDLLEQIDAIAVTEGPGLEPALWTGITFAQMLSKRWSVPIIPVNHMEGHIVGSLLNSDVADGVWQTLKPLPMPAIALLISGGHTELVKVDHLMKEGDEKREGSIICSSTDGQCGTDDTSFPLRYTIIGQTKDDAVGEAFDKVARLLGLPYPGGPHISRLAKEAREQNIQSTVKLPRPMIHSKDNNFSFSGLKTAVLYAVRDAEKSGVFNTLNNKTLSDNFKKGLAREFEESVTETLDAKLRKAIEEIGARSVIIGGGVSANTFLRAQFEKTTTEYGINLYLPSQHISGDNALMIALAGALNNSMPKREIRAHGTKKLGMI